MGGYKLKCQISQTKNDGIDEVNGGCGSPHKETTKGKNGALGGGDQAAHIRV